MWRELSAQYAHSSPGVPTPAALMIKMLRALAFVFAALSVAAVTTYTSSANPEQVAAFRATKNCPGCDLKNAQLGGFQAQNANLINADLSDATFYGGSLKGADLTGAILDRTNLAMTDLSGAVGAILATAITDERTVCPNGAAGPCS
jgi:uncharacterized protein YjbI with pentapeptide repeats